MRFALGHSVPFVCRVVSSERVSDLMIYVFAFVFVFLPFFLTEKETLREKEREREVELSIACGENFV